MTQDTDTDYKSQILERLEALAKAHINSRLSSAEKAAEDAMNRFKMLEIQTLLTTLLRDDHITRQSFVNEKERSFLSISKLHGKALFAILLRTNFKDDNEKDRHDLEVLEGVALDVQIDDLQSDGFKPVRDVDV